MSEFSHYTGCRGRDLDNCSACALLNAGSEGPNYAGWPLAFIQNGYAIPPKYFKALLKELDRTDNPAYVKNLQTKLAQAGYSVEKLKKEINENVD
jgi:hypothetical protein